MKKGNAYTHIAHTNWCIDYKRISKATEQYNYNGTLNVLHAMYTTVRLRLGSRCFVLFLFSFTLRLTLSLTLSIGEKGKSKHFIQEEMKKEMKQKRNEDDKNTVLIVTHSSCLVFGR